MQGEPTFRMKTRRPGSTSGSCNLVASEVHLTHSSEEPDCQARCSTTAVSQLPQKKRHVIINRYPGNAYMGASLRKLEGNPPPNKDQSLIYKFSLTDQTAPCTYRYKCLTCLPDIPFSARTMSSTTFWNSYGHRLSVLRTHGNFIFSCERRQGEVQR